MSELEVICQTRTPNTVETLVSDFVKLGIKNGDIVLVHSSLSAIGWVCGEERAVVEALLKVVGKEGTICMPAHSGGNSDPAEWENPPVPREWIKIIYDSMPAFDPEITPTRGIGRVAEFFRKYPGTLRSCHPQTSFCANGKDAFNIIKDHVLTPQFGMDTPLGSLYKNNSKILLLGVGYDSCTSFHLAETLCNNTARKKSGAAMDRNHNREWVWFEDYDYNCDDFDHLGKDYEEIHDVMTGKVGNAVCRLFDMRDGVDFAVKWFQKNR
jgi:aminoglycoside 3-N-acetyltransferase